MKIKKDFDWTANNKLKWWQSDYTGKFDYELLLLPMFLISIVSLAVIVIWAWLFR